MSLDSQLTMLTSLQKLYANVTVSIVDTLEDLNKLVADKPDVVILGVKLILLDPTKTYDDSPKIWLSDYLTDNGIAFTGSDTRALKIEFDKTLAKQTVLDRGLQTAAYTVSRLDAPNYIHNLRYPLFVKPANRGDSKGIDEHSLVHDKIALNRKIKSIHKHLQSDVLIEEYLSGREFSVAVMRTNSSSNQLVAMPVEISTEADARGNRFLSETIKENDSETVTSVISGRLKDTINTFAINVFKALGARDYGRIDIRLDAAGNPNFIEANLMPGLSNHGYLYRCIKFHDETVSYDDIIQHITKLALTRKKSLTTPHQIIQAKLQSTQY